MVLGNILYGLDVKVKIKGEIMYCQCIYELSEPLEVAISIFAGA